MTTLTAPTHPYRSDRIVEETPRRIRAKRGDGDRLRLEILDATDQLLIAGGTTESVSIRAVADRVGCTPPAIYLHFFDKQELLFDVCARRFRQLAEWIDSATEGIDDPVAALDAGTRAYVRFGLQHPEHYRILFMGRSILTADQLDEMRRSGVTGLSRLVERCQACIDAGQVNATDASTMAHSVWALSHGIVSLIIAKPHVEWPEASDLLDHLLGSYLRGIQA
jgi:AcrR family transcriptional regulator